MKANYTVVQIAIHGYSLFEVYNFKALNEVHIVNWEDKKNLKQNNCSIGVWKPKSK